jgi:hypothetical protein
VASVVTDKSKAEEFAKAQGIQGYELGTMEPAGHDGACRIWTLASTEIQRRSELDSISLGPDSSGGKKVACSTT